MRLYLLRHADATYDAPDDSSRDLSDKGHKTLESLCGTLRRKEFSDLGEIRHSPMLRAVKTASLFSNFMELDVKQRSSAGLQPEDDPLPLVEELLEMESDLMIVGHNPHLTFLSAYLLTGRASQACIFFKKCGLLCLERVSGADEERPGGQWALCWYLVPRVISSD